ncbi:MAG: hypothetical protein ACYCU7_12955 [Acidimicrobiales bacterium]
MSSGVRTVGGPDREKTDGDTDRAEAAGRPDRGSSVGSADRGSRVGSADRGSSVGSADPSPVRAEGASRRRPPAERRRRRLVALLAVVAGLGIAGTAGFGVAWSDLHSEQQGEAQARAAATTFLSALTNFDAKTVDADFGRITGMATGQFAGQARQFFNSTIRQELENALATSRGQIRGLYVQSYGGGQASVYGVVDQLYANNKISSPQSDVLRIVVDLTQVGSAWKVADVTVLEGPTLGAGNGGSGSTGGTGGSGSTGK